MHTARHTLSLSALSLSHIYLYIGRASRTSEVARAFPPLDQYRQETVSWAES